MESEKFELVYGSGAEDSHERRTDPASWAGRQAPGVVLQLRQHRVIGIDIRSLLAPQQCDSNTHY